MQLEVCLSLFAEYVHLVLIQTLVAAKLQLMIAVSEVDVVDSVPHMATPVARLVAFETGAATLCEAHLRTEQSAASTPSTTTLSAAAAAERSRANRFAAPAATTRS